MNYVKDINLLPAGDKASGKRRMAAVSAVVAVAAASLIFVFAWILPQSRLNKLEKEAASVSAQLEALKESKAASGLAEERYRRLDTLKTTYEAVRADKVDVLELLKKVAAVLPENVYVSSLSLNNGNNISANFKSNNPVDTIRLIVRLKQTGIFEEVELDSVSLSGPDIIPLNLKLKGTGGEVNENLSGSSDVTTEAGK